MWELVGKDEELDQEACSCCGHGIQLLDVEAIGLDLVWVDLEGV